MVRRTRPNPGLQLALFTTWSYFAFITDRALPPPEVKADHRRHAGVEQTFAELKSAGVAHLPSGFIANAAWLALTVMAHNLGRSLAILAGIELERAAAAAAPEGRHRFCSARPHRTTTPTPPPGPLALGRCHHPRTRPQPSDPAPLLTFRPTRRPGP